MDLGLATRRISPQCKMNIQYPRQHVHAEIIEETVRIGKEVAARVALRISSDCFADGWITRDIPIGIKGYKLITAILGIAPRTD